MIYIILEVVNLLSKRIQHNFYFHHFLTGATKIIHNLKFDIAPKIGGWKITFLLGWHVFRGYEILQGGIMTVYVSYGYIVSAPMGL